MNALEELIRRLASLPGIGKKSAGRIAYHLLSADRSVAESLAESIRTLNDRIRRCSLCGRYTEADPCDICSDGGRDRSTVCVVEQPQDVEVMEASGEYRGLYHVLGGVISPMDGIGPDKLGVAGLLKRVDHDEIEEVILATNPTVEGDTTALYLVKLLQERGVKCSRLALGLPVGGDLEYADRLTIARSLRGRTHY